MSTLPLTQQPVAYEHSALRHLKDAEILFGWGRLANAGQLYGFAAECGLKAMLVACGIPQEADGGIPRRDPANSNRPHPMRQHLPVLIDNIAAHGQLIPDGPKATTYMATMPNLGCFNDWLVDHRYWREAALPQASLPDWRSAAIEVANMLDQAKQDGVI